MQFCTLIGAFFSKTEVILLLFDIELSPKNKGMGFISITLMNKIPFYFLLTDL